MKMIIDSNLLLILLVGLCDPDQIGRKKHTKEFCKDDFAVLCDALVGFESLCVTPNVATECSNLICGRDNHGANACEAQMLAKLFDEGHLYRLSEHYVESRAAVQRREYSYLGLGDCSLLHLVDARHAIITEDNKLADAAQRINPASVNFNHVRTGALLR